MDKWAYRGNRVYIEDTKQSHHWVGVVVAIVIVLALWILSTR